MWDKNNLFHFDSDAIENLFSIAANIAARDLTPDEIDDYLSAYGLRREDLEMVGADSMIDNFNASDFDADDLDADDFDTDDFDTNDFGSDDFDASDGGWDD